MFALYFQSDVLSVPAVTVKVSACETELPVKIKRMLVFDWLVDESWSPDQLAKFSTCIEDSKLKSTVMSTRTFKPLRMNNFIWLWSQEVELEKSEFLHKIADFLHVYHLVTGYLMKIKVNGDKNILVYTHS